MNPMAWFICIQRNGRFVEVMPVESMFVESMFAESMDSDRVRGGF